MRFCSCCKGITHIEQLNVLGVKGCNNQTGAYSSEEMAYQAWESLNH